MKKKILGVLALFMLLLVCVVGLFACNGGEKGEPTKEEPHEHIYSNEWSYDDIYHWHAATCEHTDEKKDKAEHNFINEVCIVCQRKEYSKGLKYTLIDNGKSYEVSGIGTCTDTELIIPKTHDGLPVTAIGRNAFYECFLLQSVEIPNSVTTIGMFAFYYCFQLQSIDIPDSVTTIGVLAFAGCLSIQSINVEVNNKNFKSIDGNLYSKDGKTLIQYAIGKKDMTFKTLDNVTTVGAGAFILCVSLQNVEISDNVTTIGGSAFSYCESLQSVTIGNSVTTIGDDAFSYCQELQSVIIGNSVTTIGNSAFSGCFSLTSVKIPNSVTAIEDRAFDKCDKLIEVINLSSLNISKGSRDNGCVGYYALNVKQSGGSEIVNKDGYLFYTYNNVNCLIGYIGNDIKLILPDNYNGQSYEIYKYAFYRNDKLTSVTIGNSVTTIGNYAFEYCYKLVEVINLSSLNITKGSSDNGYVGYYALNVKQSGQSEIVNKDGYLFYTILPDYFSTYYNANYLIGYIGNDTDLILPENCNGEIYEIYKYAFYLNHKITNVIIPNSVIVIGDEAFSDCVKLHSVYISNNVYTIGKQAFGGCPSIQSIEIPDSVISIGKGAFSSCMLQNVTFKNPNGWKAGSNILSSNDLSNTLTAAQYLCSTYANDTWNRG